MSDDRWAQVKQIYNSVLDLEPDKRKGFIAEACGGDDSLRNEVELLLVREEEAERFMKSPAMAVAAKVLAKDQGNSSDENLIGQSLSHYRFLEKIGEGGMGIVYRAQDMRLDRHVAIKSLPDVFAADPSRLARFEREAKILASLNHTNIASIHGLEESDGKCFLVLELVEGRTLAERLKTGKIPLDEALEICRQIALGLEAAHEKGIIHRDLKPANIKLTLEGRVKILDFGLAKPMPDDPGSAELSQPPTGSDSMTDTGVILGTAAYMSPEQARGKPVDQRGDVWAFGCILFECLAGKRAFLGDTASEMIASVLKDEPDWNALPDKIPEGLQALLRACLHRDPDHRLHSIADARIGIENAASLLKESRIRFRARSMAAAAGLFLLTVAVAAAWLWRSVYFSRSSETSLHAVPFTTYPGIECQPSFSPDGSEAAFLWRREESSSFDIYRKMIGSGEALLPLTKDSGDHYSPAWSPDGKFIAYLANRSGRGCLCRIPALGQGAEQIVTYLEFKAMNIFRPASNIAWTPDSRYLIVPNGWTPTSAPGLFRVAADTGEMKRLTSGDVLDWDPSVSPDGREVVFVRRLHQGLSDVYRFRVTRDFQRDGEPERVTWEKAEVFTPVWTEDGKQIIFSAGAWLGERRLLRVPAAGIRTASEYRPQPVSFGENAGTLAISASSHRLLYTREFRNGNIYRVELVDGAAVKVQKLLSSTWSMHTPDFSPDDKRIAFASTDSGNEEIWTSDAGGGNRLQLTFMGGTLTSFPRWSPDGKLILFHSLKQGSVDLYVINADGGITRRLTDDPQTDAEAIWSRDGKWIYFWSDRSGKSQVYRMPASGGGATQLTRNGGFTPEESVDGRWIYYWKDEGLWKTPSSGGEEIQEVGRIGHQLNFVVVEKGIYFLDQLTPKSIIRLAFFNFATRTLTPLMHFDRPPAPPPLGLAISRDQRWLLFHLWDRFDSDLMLVENFR